MGSFTQLQYHIVFATKYRRPTIAESVRNDLYRYLAGIVDSKKGRILEIGGVADHVHLLASLSACFALAAVIRDIKANSSRWMNDRLGLARGFQWQIGYAAFTVSYSNIDAVAEYIRNQEQHHRRRTFRDEYIALLRRHGIVYRLDRLFEDEHHG